MVVVVVVVVVFVDIVVVVTVLASCGAGFGPAIQALAVDVYSRRADGAAETGRLFGVMSVLQSVRFVRGFPSFVLLFTTGTLQRDAQFFFLALFSSQIIGPAVYGLTYVKVIDFYPEGVFFVSVAATATACVALFFVEVQATRRNGA